jgi:hypothetical protein
MYILFSDTGIQFLPLNYTIRESELNNHSTIVSLIKNQWTLISLDGNPRDFARIFWREEETPSGASIRPILVVDTTVGNVNEGFLGKHDAGREFTSSTFTMVIPDDAKEYHIKWFSKLCAKKKASIKKIEAYNAYRDFLSDLIDRKIKITEDGEFDSSKGILGGFEFHASGEDSYDINVNLYIDLGNSRTTAIIYEDHQHSGSGFNLFNKLSIVNYSQYFARKRALSKIESESVFPSLLEFREPPFPENEDLGTFKLLSIAAIGEEAHQLRVQQSLKNNSDFTGLSSPKRYLWDDEPMNTDWVFTGSNGRQIQGTILRYMSLSDDDIWKDDYLEHPIQTDYPRRSLVVHFLVELLEQSIRAMNSHEFRKYSLTRHRRVLKRVVLSYPTAFPKQLTDRLIVQTNKAVKIIQTRYRTAENLSVDKGIDEANTVQCVYVQNLINVFGNNFPTVVNGVTYSSPNLIRLASIDIGGGTTDVMVSEINLSEYNASRAVIGKILYADGIQFGGDEIVRKIILDCIISKIENGIQSDTFASFEFKNIIRSNATETRYLRLSIINLLLYPLAVLALQRASNLNPSIDGDQNLFESISGKTLYEITQESLSAINNNGLGRYIPDLVTALDLYRPNLGDTLLNSFPLELTLTFSEFEQIIRKQSLFVNFLPRVAEVFFKYRPSFVLLTGKLSEIKLIKTIIKDFAIVSPERVKCMSELPVGTWYPYSINGYMEDAKTTVCVGMAIADVSTHAVNTNGLSIHLDENGATDIKADLFFDTTFNYTFSRNQLLMRSTEEVSVPVKLTGNTILIFESRTGFSEYELEVAVGSIIYELKIKSGYQPKNDNLPSVKIRRRDGLLELDADTIIGEVVSVNNGVEKCNVHHLKLSAKNVHQDFFLDSGVLQ